MPIIMENNKTGTVTHQHSGGHVAIMKNASRSNISEEQKDENISAMKDRPKSETVRKSATGPVPCIKDRPASNTVERPIKRQVSFQLNHRHNDNEGKDSKLQQQATSHVKKPVIRQCSFQHNQRRHESHIDHDSNPRHENLHQKKSLADVLPELMKKFKTELGCKSFIAKTKKAVEKRKQMEAENHEERQWMKGSEMQAFYHTWQTSDDHLKDQSVRPRTVRRIKSLPRDFRMTEPVADNKKPPKIDHSEFGIVRACCSHPRVRIPSFQD